MDTFAIKFRESATFNDMRDFVAKHRFLHNGHGCVIANVRDLNAFNESRVVVFVESIMRPKMKNYCCISWDHTYASYVPINDIEDDNLYAPVIIVVNCEENSMQSRISVTL